MNRKVVVIFPGKKGAENPLLYFSAKGYADNSYEKIFISHPASGEKEQLPYYIEPNVGHRMEVKDDLDRNLEIIGNVIRRLQER